MSYTFSVKPVESAAANSLESYTEALGLPAFSLGLLESVVHKLASIQDSTSIELQQLRHLVFCADHGAYDRSHQANATTVSSLDHVQRLLNGKAPLAKACQLHSIDLTVINCGLKAGDLAPLAMLVDTPIAQGSRDFSMMPAMTREQLEAAVQLGSQQAELCLAEGARVLSFGALGLGNTTSAAAICMALLNISAESAVTNQNRHDPMLNRDKIDVLTQALHLHEEKLVDGWSTVQHLGGFEIAAIMGAMATTAELGGMFLVDGFACSAAILALYQHYPHIVDYAQFTHQSSHIAQHAIMKHLHQRALLNLHLTLGEGTGSVMAWPLIVSAVECLKVN